MELKKNPKFDISKKSILYRNIGMTISLLLVIFAFEWKSYETPIVVLPQIDDEGIDLIDIPITKINPPPPPKVITPEPVEVDDTKEVEELEIFIDTETDELTEIPELVLSDIVEPEESDDPVVIADFRARFDGGLSAFYKYLGDNLKYPRRAQQIGVEGRVYVQFIVEKDGSLTDIQVVRGIGAGCDAEAIRVLQSSPKWTPAKQRGKTVRFKMTQPITFKLSR